MCVCVGVCLVHAGAFGGLKRVSDTLELGLQVVVSHLIYGLGMELGLRSSGRTVSALSST